jgi:hypothetical protein
MIFLEPRLSAQEFEGLCAANDSVRFADRLVGELSSWSARSLGTESDDDVSFVALHVRA